MDEIGNRCLKDIELEVRTASERIRDIHWLLRGEDGDDVGIDLRLRWILENLKNLNEHAKLTSQLSLALLIVAIVHVWRHW